MDPITGEAISAREIGPPPYPQRPPPYSSQLSIPALYTGQPCTPPPYPGQSCRPPAYPEMFYLPRNQPYTSQPEFVSSCVVQHGENRLNMRTLYSTQPGNSVTHQQTLYPLQNGMYTPNPGVDMPYVQQFPGADVRQPHYRRPLQAYTNYVETLPGGNKPRKRRKSKGFTGSMSSDVPNGNCSFTRNNAEEAANFSRPPPYPQRPPPYSSQLSIPALYTGQPCTPPPYPGQSCRPPAYPEMFYLPRNQPYTSQPEFVSSCVVQHGENRLNMRTLYSTQPGNSVTHQQTLYPLQNGMYTPNPGVDMPYVQQFPGADVRQPHYRRPLQAYTNYVETLPGGNKRRKRRKSKGFTGSMSSDVPNGNCSFTRNNAEEAANFSNSVIAKEEFSFWEEKLINHPEVLAALEKICKENLREENCKGN